MLYCMLHLPKRGYLLGRIPHLNLLLTHIPQLPCSLVPYFLHHSSFLLPLITSFIPFLQLMFAHMQLSLLLILLPSLIPTSFHLLPHLYPLFPTYQDRLATFHYTPQQFVRHAILLFLFMCLYNLQPPNTILISVPYVHLPLCCKPSPAYASARAPAYDPSACAHIYTSPTHIHTPVPYARAYICTPFTHVYQRDSPIHGLCLPVLVVLFYTVLLICTCTIPNTIPPTNPYPYASYFSQQTPPPAISLSH